MSLLSRLFARSSRETKEQLCEWMIKNISEGTTPDQYQLAAHLEKCPICGPTTKLEVQKRQTTRRHIMNRRIKIFNEGVSDLGGVLDQSTLSYEMASMFANIDTRNDFIVEGINKNPVYTDPCGDIFIGHIDNSDLNAVAFDHHGQELIGLYAGLTRTINALSFCLFGCPDFLKRTFPTKVERFNIEDVREALQVIIDPRYKPKITIAQPQNYQRAVSSVYVTGLCQTLVSFHEVGHIVGGHLMLLKALPTSGGTRLFEHSEYLNFSNRNEKLFQALEFDADAYSVGLILGCALKSPWIFFQFANLSIEDIATHYCLALNLIFHILDIFSVDGQLKSSSAHPVPGVRLAHAYTVICGYLERVEPKLLDHIPTIFAKSYADIAEFWYIIGFPRRTYEFDFGTLYEVGMEIATKQKELREDILKELCLKRRKKLNSDLK